MTHHTHQKKILFVAATPTDLKNVSSTEELAGIQNHKAFFDKHNQFELEYRFGLTPEKLRSMCMSYKPDILHYSGHSWHNGDTKLEDEKTKESVAIDRKYLSDFFSFYEGEIDCIILNSCWSIEAGSLICKHIRHVISMSDMVENDFSKKFASEFYAMLFDKQSIIQAFAYAYNFAEWNPDTRDIPILYKDNCEMNKQNLQTVLDNIGISNEILEEMRTNAQRVRKSNISDSERVYLLAEKSPFSQFFIYLLDKCNAISEITAQKILNTEDESEYLFLAYPLSHILFLITEAVLSGDERMLSDFKLNDTAKKIDIIKSLEEVMAKLGNRFDENDKGLNIFRKYTKYLIGEIVQ